MVGDPLGEALGVFLKVIESLCLALSILAIKVHMQKNADSAGWVSLGSFMQLL